MTITLVTVKHLVATGTSKVVTLTLNAASGKLLTKLHTLGGKLEVTPTGAKTIAITKTVSFKAPVVKKKVTAKLATEL